MPDADDFETFWRAYPRRVGKGAARKVWNTLRVTPDLVTTILQAIAWQTCQHQWQREGGRFIPHPATWLRQERWDDEPSGPRRSTAVAVRDPNTQYRFHCSHVPACSTWPQHRALVNSGEKVTA